MTTVGLCCRRRRMKSEGSSQRSVPGFDLLDLTLFVAVVRAGSITHGAREVHLALPSASARVRAMETALGTSLLDREHRGVKPTPAGHLLLRHARSVLHGVDHLREDLAQYTADLVSTVELQANSTAIATFLPGALTTFLVMRPDINVDLKACPSRDIVRAIRDGRADAGVVADTIDTGTLERIVLQHDELVLISSPTGPLAAHERISLHDSLRMPFVGLADGRTVQQHHEGAQRPLGPTLRYRIRLPTVEAICEAVAAGVGVSVLPRSAVERWMTVHPLIAINLTDPWAKRQITLLPGAGPTRSNAVQALIDHLTAVLVRTRPVAALTVGMPTARDR